MEGKRPKIWGEVRGQSRMRNFTEVLRWLKDAEACLMSAKRCFDLEDWRTVVQNAQLCVELSAKAIISFFNEPLWSHDPSKQLVKIIREYQEEICDKFSKDMLSGLHKVVQYARNAAPWHGWSTYGKEEEDGWIPAVELCTKEIAEEILSEAEDSFEIAKEWTKLID